eukprot:m.45189 g.45189  ORF g.45189 m.45189 type:complete len:859 (-) comp10988_c0_seq1:19-2595(-)
MRLQEQLWVIAASFSLGILTAILMGSSTYYFSDHVVRLETEARACECPIQARGVVFLEKSNTDEDHHQQQEQQQQLNEPSSPQNNDNDNNKKNNNNTLSSKNTKLQRWKELLWRQRGNTNIALSERAFRHRSDNSKPNNSNNNNTVSTEYLNKLVDELDLEGLELPLRICLVTSAIAGPTLNGGIGAAFANLVQNLAEAEHNGLKAFSLTLVYASHPTYSQGDQESWNNEYAKLGVEFVPLEGTASDYYGPYLVVRAYKVFEYLKERDGDFDAIIYHDYLGNGYFLALAKKLGLAFSTTPLVAHTHSTSRWSDELNTRPPRNYNTLAYYFIEEQSVALADVVVSPSQYFLDWLANRFQQSQATPTAALTMPHSIVIPNTIFPAVSAPAPSATAVPIEGFCFFGRLEARKGLFTFLNALDQVHAASKMPQRLAFLGPDTRIEGISARQLVLAHAQAAGWPVTPDILTDLHTTEALNYIRAFQCGAVAPSLGENSPYAVLELVANELPFIATHVGGTAELLDPAARARLVPADDATALATALLHALDHGIYTASLAVSPPKAVQRHGDLLAALKQRQAKAPPPTGPPAPHLKIAVGVSSHNRPRLLERAVDSLMGQHYPFELLHIVVVDDASTHPDTATTLAALQSKLMFAGLPHKIIQFSSHRFVGHVRNAMFDEALAVDADYICMMDEDDIALPNMLSVYASVAARTGADVLTDLSDNFVADARGTRHFSHRSVAVGNSFSHNFFINNFGKANFCVRPAAALALGGHHTDPSPYVDWGFLTRASLGGLHMELVPLPLYQYSINSTNSIFYSMVSRADRYQGHAKILNDIAQKVPPELTDALALCRYKLAIPHVYGEGN